MLTEYLLSQTEVNEMDHPLKFMPLLEPIEPIERYYEITVRWCDDHKISACPYHQLKCLKVFDETSQQNQDQAQLSLDLGLSSFTSTDKQGFDQWDTSEDADEDEYEKTSKFPVVKSPNRRVPQHGRSQAHCKSAKVNWHPRHFFRSTSSKAEIQIAQRENGRHFVRLRTPFKKLIWLAILASVTVPVTSAASVSYYFDGTILASGMLANVPSICVGTNLIPPSHGSFRLATLWYGSPTSLIAFFANQQQDYHLWSGV